ncbi:hypothetical protein CC78DRAFT_527265 [Lojkania enalia]|uniref:Glycosyl transferase CAP10 domain-containing protein n=1 Tax=Lojkania enalia TaxID=147567 RepID=A0A9P4JVA5_9PLEO|nr:hypothetical protein CC78DRAFT_527265 [Didymosphaeria enalia]
MARTMPRSLFRTAILSFTVIALCTVAVLFQERDGRFGIRDVRGLVFQVPFSRSGPGISQLALEEKGSFDRLDLGEEQCREIFPGLTKDLDDAVQRGTFVFEKSNPDYQGLVQGRIKDGKLYILTTAPSNTIEILHQRTAILQQLHRALLTSPTTLPNTHFAFVINDSPKNNSWAFARPNKESSYNTWLMPHYGLWTWPAPTLGPIDTILSRISTLESSTPFTQKYNKVIWRGTPWFNPAGQPNLRKDLLHVTANKSWADVAKLERDRESRKGNVLRIEAFCRYKYVVYTEGVTYSGRLMYHQACESVLLTPPLTWLTVSARWMKPIAAETLMGAHEQVEKNGDSSMGWKKPRELLPTVSDWHDANAIYVKPDFSNLEAVVEFLDSHPEIAQRVARNQRESVVGGGYLSSAAEVCYWRALIRGWASVATIDRSWGIELGERFEDWILRQVVERRDGTRGKNDSGSHDS